ncbi:hypothetical protein BOTBODRAFT_47710 [Botryobasidium botryosum FD-172 SS1]|uniref:Uncharacterized protein n=1 Tax=Botryobasidium botryosum (strain FD-172 SS1) TaxID=930990 RepID=A0A067MCN6_BOTB1|nr:hypothetical protein BOTBODRAFT_47710 [Botryobasidium botryosum FD-172 SS1]
MCHKPIGNWSVAPEGLTFLELHMLGETKVAKRCVAAGRRGGIQTWKPSLQRGSVLRIQRRTLNTASLAKHTRKGALSANRLPFVHFTGFITAQGLALANYIHREQGSHFLRPSDTHTTDGNSCLGTHARVPSPPTRSRRRWYLDSGRIHQGSYRIGAKGIKRAGLIVEDKNKVVEISYSIENGDGGGGVDSGMRSDVGREVNLGLPNIDLSRGIGLNDGYDVDGGEFFGHVWGGVAWGECDDARTGTNWER